MIYFEFTNKNVKLKIHATIGWCEIGKYEINTFNSQFDMIKGIEIAFLFLLLYWYAQWVYL